MKSETITQIALGAIGLLATGIFGIVGWLAVNQYDMNKYLGNVNTKVDANDQRLSRIASVLPDLKAKIAWEEHFDPIKGFIATKKPELINDNVYKIVYELYDREAATLRVYTKKIPIDQKILWTYAVAGKVREISPQDSSFQELSYCSAELKKNVMMPAILDEKNSFVIRGNNIQAYAEFFDGIAGTPKKEKYQDIYNWEKLSKHLEDITKELLKDKK